MKTADILKQKHTVLMSMDGYVEHQGLQDYTQTKLSMYDILFKLGKKFSKTISWLREEPYHSKTYNYIKEHMLPVWFVGGTFPMEQTEDEYIETYSNILCIDIDNQEIDRKSIFELPYVIGVLKSSGGVGYYVLILVEDGRYTKEYYSYLAKMFKSRFGIEVDAQCKNIGRKRVLSYENDISQWIKPMDYDVKQWKLREQTVVDDLFDNKPKRFIDYKPKNFSNSNNVDFVRKAIWKLLNSGYSIDDMSSTSKYGSWYYIACEFAHFSDGEEMFIRFSQNSSNYNDSINDIMKKWRNADKSKCNQEEVYKKWCGICKNKFGNKWWKED